MGWDPRELGRPQFLISQHPGRHPRRRRHARSRSAITPATGRSACCMQAAARGADGAGRHAVRRLLHRPLRRPHAGHAGHDGQPALPQRRRHRAAPADPLAADAQGRARRRHLRQGPAGDDDGAGRACATCRACSCPAASRCRRATARTRARCRRSAPASPTARSRCERPPSWAAAPAARRAAAASSSAPRRRRRSSARRWACRCRTRRWRRRASRSGSTWPRRSARALVALRSTRHRRTRDILTDAAVRNAMVVHAAFGGSTNLLLHIPAIAHAAGLPRPDGGGLDRRQPPACRAWSTRCRTARVGHPDRARLPRRRRARGDAAPARARPARRATA